MSVAVSVRGIRKAYGRSVALEDLTLEVALGQIVGLVGPDGAGKSTAIRVLSTATPPTGGSATIAGFDITMDAERVRQRVGVVPQAFSLYGDLTVTENLDFLASAYGLDPRLARERYPGLLALARLGGHESKLAGDLSGGMKRKLAVVCALIHQPEVLLLDEPTAGVDPISRRELWKMIGDLVGEGLSVLLTTAYMDEAERCQQVAFLNGGRVVARGSPNELRSVVGDRIAQVAGTGVATALATLRSLPGIADVRVLGNQLRVVRYAGGPSAQQIADAAIGAGVPDANASIVTPSMEDVFMSLRISAAGSAE